MTQTLIEVAYNVNGQPSCLTLSFSETSPRVSDVLQRLALMPEFKHHQQIFSAPMFVFGRPVKQDQQLRHEDRLELCWPIRMDPKEMRRLLAAKKRI